MCVLLASLWGKVRHIDRHIAEKKFEDEGNALLKDSQENGVFTPSRKKGAAIQCQCVTAIHVCYLLYFKMSRLSVHLK